MNSIYRSSPIPSYLSYAIIILGGERMDKKIITSYEEFLTLEEDWIRLEQQDPDALVYNSFSFTKSWLKVYEKDDDISPLIIVLYHNDKIAGIGPFYILKRKKLFLKWQELHFINQGDYHNLLLDRSILSNVQKFIKEIVETIEEKGSLWDRMVLSYIDSKSDLAHYFLKNEKYNPLLKYLVESPTLYLNKFENFNDLKRGFSKNIKNFKNKLKKETGYTFEIHNSINRDLYEQIAQLHRMEQKYLQEEKNKTARRSLYNDALRNEYIELVSKQSPVILFLLRDSHGEIICYNYNFVFKKRLYSWNIAYNPTFKQYRTNSVLYYDLLHYLYERDDILEFDFGAGRYPWKYRWTKDFYLLYELDYWKPRNQMTALLSKYMKHKK